MTNDTLSQSSMPSEVTIGLYPSIRARIDTLLLERGIKWSMAYRPIGWTKSFASLVRNGKVIPKSWQRVALAKQLGVDTSVLWDFPEIQTADKYSLQVEKTTIKEQYGEVSSSPEPSNSETIREEEK